jgi:hypothetical protein
VVSSPDRPSRCAADDEVVAQPGGGFAPSTRRAQPPGTERRQQVSSDKRGDVDAAQVSLQNLVTQLPHELARTTTLTAASATEIDDVLLPEITELEDNRDSYLDNVNHEATNLDADIAGFQEVQAGKVADSWTPIRPDVDPGDGWQHGSAS